MERKKLGGVGKMANRGRHQRTSIEFISGCDAFHYANWGEGYSNIAINRKRSIDRREGGGKVPAE